MSGWNPDAQEPGGREPVEVPEDVLSRFASSATADDVDLAAFLRAYGVPDEEVDAAEAVGCDALRRLGYAHVVLGGPTRYTVDEVRAAAGTPEGLSTDLWRAMGFADLPREVRALTDLDVAALGMVAGQLDGSSVDAESVVRFTRLLGQAMGRIADALIGAVERGIHERLDDDHAAHDAAVVATAVLVPVIEEEVQYLLRRHLYAAASRRLVGDDEPETDTVVGFADVVQFTRLSGQLPESDLAALLEAFEAETSALIANRGGRVVKLIGDAVMFTVDTPQDAAALALDLVDTFGGDLPQLRVGMAMGPVIERLGDVFGPTVNLASRLVAFARPGTVLVNAPLADALRERSDAPASSDVSVAGPATVRVVSLRPRELKGLGETRLSVIRRAD